MAEPAYTRLQVDERRAQLLDAGKRLFAEHAFEEISMREIAQEAGISKPLLYHYFPSKIELFKAAVADQAEQLQRLIEPSGEGAPFDQLRASLDAYLEWIQANSRTWAALMRSAATLPEATSLVEGFRAQTLRDIVERLTGDPTPRPALRNALNGWLGYIDAAILDWVRDGGIRREQVREMILATFGGALLAAQNADPEIELRLA
jgi:AcrR family transcriptional regulator